MWSCGNSGEVSKLSNFASHERKGDCEAGCCPGADWLPFQCAPATGQCLPVPANAADETFKLLFVSTVFSLVAKLEASVCQ